MSGMSSVMFLLNFCVKVIVNYFIINYLCYFAFFDLLTLTLTNAKASLLSVVVIHYES